MPASKSKPKPREVVIDFDEAMKYPALAVPGKKAKAGKVPTNQAGDDKESAVKKNQISTGQLKRMKLVLRGDEAAQLIFRRHHYGPGPHKDGSSQDVHGGGRGGQGAGKSGPAGTRRGGESVRREKINASHSAIIRPDGSVEIWNEHPGGAELKVKLDQEMVGILSRTNHPLDKSIRLNPSFSAIFRDDGSVEIWNQYPPSGSKPGGANRVAKIDKEVFGRLIG